MILLATVHTDSIKQLSDLTWEGNKVKYAEKHGYGHVAKTDNWTFGRAEAKYIYWERMQFILDLFEEYPETEWLWITGSDSMITNFNTKVEDKISDTHDILIAGDFNEIMVNDSVLIKNTPRARKYYEDMMAAMPEYLNAPYGENSWVLDTYDQYKDQNLISIQPQWYMNSYEYRFYSNAPWHNKEAVDKSGNRGQWEPGDWLVHWPGTQHQERLALVEEYKDKIIY
jgi:hypothetical protein